MCQDRFHNSYKEERTMKKRVLAVLLSAAMVASLAVGCGRISKSDEKSETKTETAKDTKKRQKMLRL